MLRYFRKLYGDPRRIAPGSLEGYTAGLDVPGSFEHLLRVVRSWHRDLALIEESLPAISGTADSATVGIPRHCGVPIVSSCSPDAG